MTPRLEHSSDNDATGAVPAPVVENPSAPGEETTEFTLPVDKISSRGGLLAVLIAAGVLSIAALSDDKTPEQRAQARQEMRARFDVADGEHKLNQIKAVVEGGGEAQCEEATPDTLVCAPINDPSVPTVTVSVLSGNNLSVRVGENTPRTPDSELGGAVGLAMNLRDEHFNQ